MKKSRQLFKKLTLLTLLDLQLTTEKFPRPTKKNSSNFRFYFFYNSFRNLTTTDGEFLSTYYMMQ